MTEGNDPVLKQMATEVRRSLEKRGLDATNPPMHSRPPGQAIFGEYVRRGGEQIIDPDQCAKELVEEVVRQAKTEMRSRVFRAK